MIQGSKIMKIIPFHPDKTATKRKGQELSLPDLLQNPSPLGLLYKIKWVKMDIPIFPIFAVPDSVQVALGPLTLRKTLWVSCNIKEITLDFVFLSCDLSSNFRI